ncbi:hypothetical protein BSLG_008847 [Batrachochytrium salamandrivorans]|nr:hypothetical protein BSLG_008847 [Batrachochytrium salamandrivorans]
MAEIHLDARSFHKRAKLLLESFSSGGPDYAAADTLCFMVGAGDDTPVYSKSIALQTWLLGYEFPDTITAVVEGKLFFITTVKKGAYLDQLHIDKGVSFEVLKRTKDETKLGVITKDEAEGKNISGWKKALASNDKKFQEVDVSAAIASLLSIKDDDELKTIRLAAKISSAAMNNYFIPQMSSIIDDSKSVSHEKLTGMTEDALLDEGKSKKLKLPSDEQESNYKLLCDLHAYLLTIMKDGVLSNDVYSKACEYIEEKRPALKSHFTKNCGFVIGIEFRESQFLLTSKISRPLRTGMTFNLAIGFQNLVNSKARIAAVVLSEVDKDLGSISYAFGNDSDEDEAKVVKHLPKSRGGAVIESKLRHESDRATTEQRRKLHQKELAQSRQNEGLSRYSENKDGKQKVQQAVVRRFESYRKESQLPRNIGELRILVDRRSESILLPIFGQSVPFHISTLKNVSKSDEQDFVLLRFNFVTPGQSVGKKEGPTPFEDPNATFVRALSYRSNDIGRFVEIYREISELKKEMQKREAERLEMADLVEQASLMEVKGRRPTRLPDVFVRPGLEGKRFPGDLEIHLNGLRYQSQLKSDQKIDILFSNVKHLFFQPCDGELIVLLHVNLKNPIMMGKKKTKDIQFYREVSDASFDETGNRRRRVNYGDEDELAQEQEERRKRLHLNREFQQFSERIGEMSKRKVLVDVPLRDVSFSGVPFRQLVILQPTTDCLVHLSDTPFLVIPVKDIEVAHLERVQFGLKNFDLVFVYKDFHRPVTHINTIPVNQVETVREWLDSSDIPFSEGPVNLSWPQIMKTINDDPKAFYEEAGGWSFLQIDGSDHGSSEEESESEFEMSGSASGVSGSDSDETSQGSDASGSGFSDSGSGSGSGSGEEDASGEDWDELERKAEQHDRKRHDREQEQGDDDHRRAGKKGRR